MIKRVLLFLWVALLPGAEEPFTPKQRSYWAFQPVRRPPVPASSDRWVRNPIDAFILQKLRAKELAPSAEASRALLMRRAHLDLTGLPPTLEQVEAFAADRSPRAFENLVDRLLESPQYGERWARHWLDVARFAESTGFEDDITRPNAWRYRDYVIKSINTDKPYDRFVQEQIAGDELWPEDFDARIATAFNRHYPEEGNNKDLLLARQEMLHDITSVTGAAFLGLTFECARCHDHKFDPIRQRDYYKLQAFFANVMHDDRLPLAAGDELKDYSRRMAAWEATTKPIWDQMSALLMPKRTFTPAQLLERYPDYAVEAVKTAEPSRTPLQEWMVQLLATKGTCGTCPLRPPPYADPLFRNVMNKLSKEEKKRFEELEAELAKHDSIKPKDIPRGIGMFDVGDKAPPTHVLGVGVYTSPGEEVQPGFLSILDGRPPEIQPVPGKSTGRRSALAQWLTDPANPLTARVMVNRVWHHHFGSGIVATPGDFGVMGARPTHLELLDWLTADFVANGWSLKRLHRLIMTSSAYRQNSQQRAAAREVDPSNKLLWRYPPQRLEAEAIRDSALAVAGLLNGAIGGPSVFPPLPANMPKPVGGWDVNKDAAQHHRRSVYIFVRRNDPYPMLNAIDFPDSHETCSRRNRTTTAPQALTLLNSPLMADWSRHFAARLKDQEPAQQVKAAYRLAYAREPEPRELDTALTFLAPQNKAATPADTLADFCLMLMNSNEFVYRF